MSQVRYQPLGPLLSGEGSRAFLGLALEDGAPPQPVVLIWAPQEVAQDPDLTDRLRRETNRAVVFEHPNILRVHGLVTLEQGLARVTEYADGETLRRVMEVTPRIPPPLAAKIVADAAMGIHYAHMAGNDDGSPLVHGDVRPETLIISFTGMVKVTGYGALGVAPRERGGRRVRNRRKYSAPEQLLGGRDAVNLQTDVFLLGLTLYELLTGKIPFKDAKDADTATLTEALPPLPLTIPRALDAVVHKATAKRANERYPTALALREAIVEAMGDLPPQDILQTFMNRLFPVSDEARSARIKVLDFGISEARKHAGVSKPTTGSTPTVAPAAPAPAAPRVSAPATTSSPPAPAARGPASASTPVVARPTAPAPAPAPTPSPTGSHPVAPAPTPSPTGSHPVAPASTPSPTGSHPVAPAPTPSPTGSHPVAPVAAPAPAPAPMQPAAVAPAPVPPVAPPAPSRSRIPLIIGALALVSVGAAVVVSRGKLPGNIPGLDELLNGGNSSSSITPIDPLDLVDAGVAADAGLVADAGADAGTDGGVDAGTELELIVDPRVDALLSDGGVIGRTPVTVPLPAGRHVISFSSPSLGINTARSVTVNPLGRTTARFYLNKGYVNVRAPEGGVVQVDGRNVGTTPVDELDLYEGQHRLTVTVNGARWQKIFSLEASQRLTFTVDFEDQDE
ncbi:protein kinase domain-containing protein [Hyalangium versicolor]|uniref:protein kinase domain-containing protein n=1 Tax=Hyalangium versicolor TaxID=2861190 RepID=UPI001CCFCE33|nr:protein kinase [Hyalangium versicolor]